MKILVVGHYKKYPSEGMEVITSAIVNTLQNEFSANVQSRTSREVILGLLEIKRFQPELVVFTHGPGKGVLVLSRLIHSLVPAASIFWVASRPTLAKCPTWLLRYTYVDHILTGRRYAELMQIEGHRNCGLHDIIIGIDFDRLDICGGDRQSSRDRLLGKVADTSTPLVIHVGHIRHNRGLEQLMEIKKIMGQEVEIVVIGSPSLTVDQDLLDKMISSGVFVYREYIENLSTYYRCADCYVFPADPQIGGAVDLPLSVIESLACGTPVISSRFGVLNKVIKKFQGIIFCAHDDIAKTAVKYLEQQKIPTKVDPIPNAFDLKNVARIIMDIAN